MKVILCVIVFALFALALGTALGQPKQTSPRRSPQKRSQPAQILTPPVDEQKLESAAIDNNLITVSVTASTNDGRYVGDLTKEEFKVTQDGAVQEVTFMAKASSPLYVILLIDTSDSTKDKLGQLQQAAVGFVEQLDQNAKVKLISFNGAVRDWNDFSSDKSLIEKMIRQTQSGHDTRVYDAVQMALNALRPIQQRKALVIFTDGMDWHSESATAEGTLRTLDEAGVSVYPIRFDTRADTERLAREQDAAINGSQLPTSDVVRRTTKPGDLPPNEEIIIKSNGTSPSEIIFKRPGGGGRPVDPRTERRDRRTEPDPRKTEPGDNVPDLGKQKGLPPFEQSRRGSGNTPPADPQANNPPPADPITAMLDKAYLTADNYLKELADRSGGKLQRADTIVGLPQAFAAITAELRTQYLIGYYPKEGASEGAYHKITVNTSRKDVTIRSRPGYRAPAAN